MPIDDRIPDALERAAGALPRAAGDWDAVRSRAVGRRNRRRGQSGIALVAAAVLAGGLAFGTGDNDDHSVVASPPEGAEVVATINGQVVVLSAEDGHVVRTLSENAPNLDAISVTVTPDGETVYVQRGTQCDGAEPPSIWKMSTHGSPANNIGPPGYVGIAPLVSPDGRWLAYAGTTNDAPGVCGPFDRLIVESLTTGVQLHLDYTPSGSVTPVAWDATSSQLGVFINEPAESLPPYAVVAVSDKELVEARRLPQPVGNGFSFLPSNEAITAFPTETTSRIATFDPGTGAEGRTVAEISMPLYLIDVNRTGDAFLLEGPLADTPNGHDLYRAEIGDPEPVKIAEHVKDAVWLPSTPRPEGEIVARIVDEGVTKLVVISASDGSVLRTLPVDSPLNHGLGTGMSVPADGRFIYSATAALDGGCAVNDPEVVRLPRDGGTPELVVGASLDPVISSDGQWVAYIAGHECGAPRGTLGLTNLATGENYRPFEGNDRWRGWSQPEAWSPDASRLVLQGPDDNDDGWPDLFLMDQIPFDADPHPITLPGYVESAAYLPDGRLVVAYVADGRHNVVTVDDNGEVTEPPFQSISEGLVSISADASGRLLLVFDSGVVQVWTPGDTMPTTVIPDVTTIEVQSAAWLPSPSPSPSPTPTVVESNARPESIVAVQAGQLVEMDSDAGAILQEIARATSLVGSAISMSPDGTEVFGDGVNSRHCANRPFTSFVGIARVALSDGTVRPLDLGEGVRSGGGALWSPDGELYAYSATDCDEKSSVVVRDRAGGKRHFTAVDGTPFPVGWDADGQHLLVGVSSVLSDGSNQFWYIDTSDSGRIEERGVLVPTLGNLSDLEPLGASGRWVAVIGGNERDGTVPQFVEYDLERGIATRTLFAWEGLDQNMSVRVIATDSSGRHLLVTTFVEGGPGFVLYRWSEGDAQPTKIAEEIAGADW